MSDHHHGPAWLARITAWPWRIIISMVTPTVLGRPCMTMPDRIAHLAQHIDRADVGPGRRLWGPV